MKLAEQIIKTIGKVNESDENVFDDIRDLVGDAAAGAEGVVDKLEEAKKLLGKIKGAENKKILKDIDKAFEDALKYAGMAQSYSIDLESDIDSVAGDIEDK